MATQNLYVSGAGHKTEWDWPIADPHWEQVDETSQDGDSTTISDNGIHIPNGSGEEDYFNVDNWTHGSQFIEKVEVIFWARLSEGTGNVTPLIYLDGYAGVGSTPTLTGSYAEYTEEFSKPGGGNWDYTDIDDIEVGVRSGGGGGSKLGNNIRVTQIYLKVTYHDQFDEIPLNGHVEWGWPTTFYLTANSSDLGDGDGTGRFDKDLEESYGSPTWKSIIPGSGSSESSYGFTEAGVPNNADWETGNFVVTIYVLPNSESANISLKVRVSRINGSGIVQESSDWSETQTLDIADHQYNFEVPSKNWSSGNASDRMMVIYRFTDDGLPGTRSVIIWFDHEDVYVKSWVVWNQTQTDTIELDGHVLLTGTDTIELDGHVLLTGTDAINLDGHVLLTTIETIDLDGHVLFTTTDTINLDGHILLTDTDAIALDGHILLTDQTDILLDGHIFKTGQETIEIDGHILKTSSAIINLDGHIIATGETTIDLDGHVVLTKTGLISLDGHILKIATAQIDLDGHIMTTSSDLITLAGFVVWTESTLITLIGHVTDKGIGRLAPKGWYNKPRRIGRTEYWGKR